VTVVSPCGHGSPIVADLAQVDDVARMASLFARLLLFGSDADDFELLQCREVVVLGDDGDTESDGGRSDP